MATIQQIFEAKEIGQAFGSLEWSANKSLNAYQVADDNDNWFYILKANFSDGSQICAEINESDFDALLAGANAYYRGDRDLLDVLSDEGSRATRNAIRHVVTNPGGSTRQADLRPRWQSWERPEQKGGFMF